MVPIAGTAEYEAAAKKLPKNRSTDEQALVDNAYSNGMTGIKNLDFAAQQTEKNGG